MGKKHILILLCFLTLLVFTSCDTNRTLILPTSNADQTGNILLNTIIVSNTTTETTIYEGEVLPNSLKQNQIIKVLGYGVVSTASASDSVTIRFKVGGVTKQTFTLTPKLITNEHLHIEGTTTQRTLGTSGIRATHQDICIGDECSGNNGVGTIDTTSNSNLTITAQWNNAKVGNTLSLYQGFMEFKNGY